MLLVLLEIILLITLGTAAGLLARIHTCTARRCQGHAA